MVFSLFAGERQGLALALPAKIHTFRLRCAPCGTVVPLKVTLGKSAILPRFITLFWVQRHAAARLTRKNLPLPPSLARQVALVRKMRTTHFRGNACKMRFAALDLSEKQKGKRQEQGKPRLPFRFSLA